MTEEPLWKHQAEDLERSWRSPGWAFPWPPRIGKSRVAVETARRLRDAGEVDACVVVAPNGVHLEWSRVQVPRYWDDAPRRVVEWDSGRVGRVDHRRELAAARSAPEFVWVVANVEALRTSSTAKRPGRLERYLAWLMRARRTLLVVDESHVAKDPRAKQTRALLRLAKLAPYRRVLSGTMAPNGPFDLWAQYRVVDPDILERHFGPFKARYGVFRQVRYGSGPLHPELVEYRRLDDLRERVAPVTSWRRKEDCLDLPERTLSRRYFVLPEEHRRAYESLRRDLVARLAGGEEVTASTALTLLLRLQQVSRGVAATDDGERLVGDSFPAVDAALELVESNPGKSIVWCRFRADVELVCRALWGAGVGHVRCDGTTPADERPGLRDRFRDDPDVRAWVGTPATGGVGVDLGAADLMVFYSHGYDRVQREQALERNYGSTQRAARVDVVDLVAADTVDERALRALAEKADIARKLDGAALLDLLS